MRLPRAGRETYTLQANSIPGILFSAVEASFDNGATWHMKRDDGVGSDARWLIAGPDLDEDAFPPIPGQITVEHDVLVLVRALDGNQQVVIRPASHVRLVDAASILSLADVITGLGIGSTDDLTDDEVLTIEDAISRVTSDLVAYLGQPIIPTPITLYVGDPSHDIGHTLIQYPGARDVEYYIGSNNQPYVRFVYGIDARFSIDTQPIRDYLRAAVLNDPVVAGLWRSRVGEQRSRLIRSVSTEGQSATFDLLTPTGVAESRDGRGSGSGGGDPRAVLDRWRVAKRRVYMAPGWGSDPLLMDVARDTFRPWGAL